MLEYISKDTRTTSARVPGECTWPHLTTHQARGQNVSFVKTRKQDLAATTLINVSIALQQEGERDWGADTQDMVISGGLHESFIGLEAEELI